MLDTAYQIRGLIKKFHIGEITEAELEHLNAWRNESSENEAEFQLLTEASFVQKEMRAVHAIAQETEETLAKIVQSKRVPVRRLTWLRMVAAAAIIVFAITGYLLLTKTESAPELVDKLPGTTDAKLVLSDGTIINLKDAKAGVIATDGAASVIKTEDGKLIYKTGKSKGSVKINRIETPPGGQFHVTLPDNSVAILNSTSAIEFPTEFSGKDRVIHFSGEGFFHVSPDARRPFHVMIKGQDIRVLGTKFVVTSFPEDAKTVTTLVEGSVSVTATGNNTSTGSKETLTLKSGEAAIFDTASRKLTLNKAADVEAALDFTKNQLVMNSAPASVALQQIARWYDVQLVMEKGFRADTIIISGIIEKDQKLSEVREILKVLGVHSRMDGNKMIVGESSK
jgi:transmembrane sensor